MHPTQNQSAEVEVTPADTLRGAALYLKRHGWTQVDYYRLIPGASLPAACMLGGIGMAVHGQPIDDPMDPDLPAWHQFQAAYDALCDYLTLNDPAWADSGHDTVGDWNDAPGRTVEQVITTLNNAADEWNRQHPATRTASRVVRGE